LDALHDEMAHYTDTLRPLGAEELRALCPILRTGPGELVHGVLDVSGLKLDAEALLQSFARSVRSQGSQVLTGYRIVSIERGRAGWTVGTDAAEEWAAPILINAAGAWCDHVAALAGVAPLGLQPMRRTIIVVDPPEETVIQHWPFVHSAGSDFYMLPEAGRLLVSPMDELPCDPCDAYPEEYDMALAAAKLEEHTTLSVRRIAHSWAGLRSFVRDRVPTAGFAPDASGFFWLTGQGGYGLQTAPALAEVVEALTTGGDWPSRLSDLGVTRACITPARFGRSAAPVIEGEAPQEGTS
jgi:D-arginine dehydrogenase